MLFYYSRPRIAPADSGRLLGYILCCIYAYTRPIKVAVYCGARHHKLYYTATASTGTCPPSIFLSPSLSHFVPSGLLPSLCGPHICERRMPTGQPTSHRPELRQSTAVTKNCRAYLYVDTFVSSLSLLHRVWAHWKTLENWI